ncbi:MAG: hypothetical protein HY731_05000 [Candidatus Tectomicrobia bacterium]|nr:hypothetical protein [Candidatus Tectomicrobia bacterium]
MFVQMQGVIHGKHIELERDTGLPSGSIVIVNIQSKPLTLEENRQLVDALCGAWANDTNLTPIFAEIEHQRNITISREVHFHVAS